MSGRTPYTDPVTEPNLVPLRHPAAPPAGSPADRPHADLPGLPTGAHAAPPDGGFDGPPVGYGGPPVGYEGSPYAGRPGPPSGPAAPPSAGSAPTAAAPVAPRTGWLLAAGVGALVAVGIGVYGRIHEPAFFAINVGGFSSGTAAKAWLATLAFVLALVQLGSAMIMYGRIGRITAPSWIGVLHRWSGRVAVIATVPVAIHCLYALGFQSGEPRVLVHSLFGCFFYGVFVAKMLLLQRSGAPKWSLPVFGGAVFTALVGLWLTSSLWFFTTSGLTF